ncbi:hypothetical protein R1sor_003473 [Riccia sorocarpa]|uniref:Proteasome subunit beta type-3 n=1 Tax=Riccia sorocarpa TaxID=122646 RepID=A0ABD3H5T4_9MARC
MSISSYNGSALVAMLGKNCSAIASDRRFGVNFQTIARDNQHNAPFICMTDLIGAKQFSSDFVVSGTASEFLYCESMYKPDLEPQDLFEVISQALLSSVDRDCISGWGGIVYVVTPDLL